VSESDAALDTMPFVAPCRTLAASAALRWLRLGWRDMMAAPLQSLGFGVGIALLSAVVASIALRFVAPVLAIGLYAISAALERGVRPSFAASLAAAARHVGDVMVYCLILMVICLVWVRAGSAVEIFFPEQAAPSGLELGTFFLIGGAVGSVFALVVFAASAFSLPMLVDRRTDAVTAVVTSINAVLRNRKATFVWALVIVLSVAVGFATALVGLAFTMPLIGHATWHAYRETIDASGWPPNSELGR
jgi:uncharacterized membrane protein